jgi:hypothetical protein
VAAFRDRLPAVGVQNIPNKLDEEEVEIATTLLLARTTKCGSNHVSLCGERRGWCVTDLIPLSADDPLRYIAGIGL